MKNTEKFLESLGLSPKESSIYLSLLQYGPMTVSEIFRKTGINRVGLYSILPKMISKIYVSQFKKEKRNYFIAENPEKLELIFLQQRKDFDVQISELKNIFHSKKQKPIVKFLEGKNGIKKTFEDMVISSPKGSTIYRYSGRKKIRAAKHDMYYKLRDSKKIERKVITSEEKAHRKKSKLERFVKIVPKEIDLFDDNVSQFIYANKVAFVDYENEISFIIESEKIATFQKKIFKLLYSKL